MSFTQPQVPRLGRHWWPGPHAVEAVHAQAPPVHVLPAEHTVDAVDEVQVPGWQVCVVASQRCAPQNPTVASQRGKQNPSPVGVWRQKYPGRHVASEVHSEKQTLLVPPRVMQIAPAPHSVPIGQPRMQ